MIVSRIFSGLGNQMFQYSIARSLSIENNTRIWLDNIGFANDKLREYRLDGFQLKCKLVQGFQPQRINKLGWEVFGFKKYRINYYTDKIWEFDHNLLADKSRYIYLSGYWAWPGYFEHQAGEIKKDFILLPALETAIGKWIDLAKKNNSISLHIRRSDYVSDQHATEFFGVLNLKYYEDAITYINNLTEEPFYFIFSDDMEWVSKNFISLAGLTNYVLVKDDCFTHPAQELVLMSYCSHNIIANSTFSWWGAWLNNNPQKIVIQPKNWYLDVGAQKAYDRGILNIAGAVKI